MKKQTLNLNNPNAKLRKQLKHMLTKNLRLVIKNDELKELLVERDKEISKLKQGAL